MTDRKRLKEAIKSVLKGKGADISDYEVKPAVDNVSYIEGGNLQPFIDFAKAILNFSAGKQGKKDLDNLTGRGNFGYETPEFEEMPHVGSALVANGMKRHNKKKGGLVAEGLVAEGMPKKIGLAYRGKGASASLPYSNLYGSSLVANGLVADGLVAEGFNYDKEGERKKGAPRGDKGAALRKFNAIVKELRSKDKSLSLPEARAKAKAMYRA
jgi:hypothetical protein